MPIDWGEVMANVRACLRRRRLPKDDLDDLIHEAWLRMDAYRRRGRAVEEPEAFLLAVAVNLSIDQHRARRRHAERALDDDDEFVDPAPNPEDVVFARERKRFYDCCMKRLDGRTQRILRASRVDGITHLQIARKHRLSVSAVQKVIAKGLLALGRCMQECEQ